MWDQVGCDEWRPSYKRGALMQAPLLWSGLFSLFFLGGWMLLLAVVPFTLIVIFPTNKLLDSDELDLTTTQGGEHLLRLWGKLHAVRSALSAFAFVI